MQTDSSLSEPGEPRLRIALSCRRTHCIRTLYPHSLESGVQSEQPRNPIAVGVRLHAIRIPNPIAPRDRIIRPARTTDTTGII